MKKVLAIVLTLAMLLSSMAVGLSAAQVVTENKTENHIGYAASNGVAAGWGIDKVFSLDILLEGDCDGRISGYNVGGFDSINIDHEKIGIGSENFTSGMEYDTWYNVKFDASAGDGTDIYVNGVKVGHANAAIGQGERRACSGWYGVKFDNVRVLDENGNAHVEDFEDGVFNVKDHQCCSLFSVLVDETVTVTNENVYEVVDSNKYWQWDEEYAYAYFETTTEASYQLMFDFRLDDASSETRNWGGMFIVAPDKVGVGGATQPADLKVGEWYKILYNSIAGQGTGIVVWNSANEVVVQTAVSENLGSKPCGNMILLSVDNIVVSKSDGTVIWTEDFQDGVFNNKGDSNGIIANDKITVRNDLGLKHGSADSIYGVFEVSDVFSMDFALQEDNGGVEALAEGPYRSFKISTTKIGVNSDLLDYNFTVGEWYNVVFDKSAGNGTDIYVNGAKVGHVGTAFATGDNAGNVIQTFRNIYFDNVTSKNADGKVIYVEDFEDGKWNVPTGDGCAFGVLEYIIKVDTIFDHFETKEVGGEATLLDQTPVYGESDNNTYLYDSDNFKVNEGSFIMNFDLAVLSNDPTNSNGSCFELWTQKTSGGALVRWKVGLMPTADGIKGFVGTESGDTKDYTTFTWENPGLDSFKNVTYYLDFEHNLGQIYIDKEVVYEAKAGAKTWDSIIFMTHNASCVLDNIQLMDLSYNSITPVRFSSEYGKTVNLDAEDFCAANGHVSGPVVRTAQPKCYEVGTDDYMCAVCGAVKASKDVPMVAHNWDKYDMNRVTGEGLRYTYCKNSGCVEKRYTSIPTADEYVGKLHEYYDMEDDMFLVVPNDWGSNTFAVADGVLKYGKGTDEDAAKNSYIQYSPVSSVQVNNWSWNFDLVYNGIYDTNDAVHENGDGKGYGHVFFFWVGGASGYTLQLGYNKDVNAFFLLDTKSNANQSDPLPGGTVSKAVDYEMVEGEVYNIQMTVDCYYDANLDEEDEAYGDQRAALKLYVNGEEIIDYSWGFVWDEDWEEWAEEGDFSAFTMVYDPTVGRTSPVMIMRIFGMDLDFDNMAIGDGAFNYVGRTYKGDLDGDNALTAADTLMMRKYLARVLGDKDILTSRADANSDGTINAKDQLVMRKALAQ